MIAVTTLHTSQSYVDDMNSNTCISEKLLDDTWTDSNQFEKDIIDAMENNYTGGASNDEGHDEKKSSDDRKPASHGSDTIDLGADSDSNMDKGARAIFFELERIKRVICDATSVPLSTLNEDPQKTHGRKVCNDHTVEVEHQLRKEKVRDRGYGVEIGQQARGDNDKHMLLKEENIRLKEIIKQRDQDLAQARAEIKALLAPVAEVDHLSETHQSKAHARAIVSSSTSGYRKTNKYHLLGLDWQRKRKSSGQSLPTALRDHQSMPSMQDGRLIQDHIRAFLRLRPMSKLEMSRRSRNCFDIHDDNAKFTVDSLSGDNDFCYDKVFGPDVSQTEMYNSFGSQVVHDLMSGINCCVMAYGLASSGRTYTITGALPDFRALHAFQRKNSGTKTQVLSSAAPLLQNSHFGIAPRLLGDLFESIRSSPSSCEYVIKCSYVAVYLEKVFDLLQSHEKRNINVYEDSRGVHVDGLSEACCFEEGDILGLIQRGQACLCVLSSRMNVEINQSHSILIISVTKLDRATRHSTTARLQLADLAAFEVPVKAKGKSPQEVKINQKCFSALGNVVKGLVEKGGRVPYTDSKLTSILKDALGGNCRTYFIVTASPSSYSIRETLSTIRIGQRMRRIHTNPQINANIDVDVYKEWINTLVDKLKGFVVFAQRVIDAVTQDTSNGPHALSAVLWEALPRLLDKDRNFFADSSAEFRGPFAVLALENWLKEWNHLNQDISRPCTLPPAASKSNTKAESLLFDIQSEVVVLRRQNDLLVQEKRKKDEESSDLKKELKLLRLKIAELEHNLNLAEFKEKQAKLFLRQFRKICWNLQKDFLTEQRVEISDITGECPPGEA